jgi:hypothetical protein
MPAAVAAGAPGPAAALADALEPRHPLEQHAMVTTHQVSGPACSG